MVSKRIDDNLPRDTGAGDTQIQGFRSELYMKGDYPNRSGGSDSNRWVLFSGLIGTSRNLPQH